MRKAREIIRAFVNLLHERRFRIDQSAAPKYPMDFTDDRSRLQDVLEHRLDPDAVEDEEYLSALLPAVEKSLDEFRPDILFYVGGADPFCEDQLGALE